MRNKNAHFSFHPRMKQLPFSVMFVTLSAASPMEFLSCASCSEFRVGTVLSRSLDPPSGREPPEVSSNLNHSINVLSTPLWLISARTAEGTWAEDNRHPQLVTSEALCPQSWQSCDGHGNGSCSSLHRSALQARMPFQGAQRCPGYFWQILLNIITFKLFFHRHFKSFSYRTVIKSHQIISVTVSRELIGESVMLRRENQSWIYQLGWEFEMYLGSYSE